MSINMLGSKIKELRTNSGLSQIEFAKKLNISNTTLSMYEAGKRVPSDEVKQKIADCFNVSIDYLLGREYRAIDNKILDSIEFDSELLQFVKELSTRENMRLFFTQLASKSDNEIARIMRYIKFLEDEDTHNNQEN